ncbi:hypothetical protein NMY22_g10136 [Coprinellus aureogranulatus]|nr:hypothetical protein NMY22_g10136 [Coprinellus aureogranulatus]
MPHSPVPPTRSAPPHFLRRLFTSPSVHLFYLRCLILLSSVALLYTAATGYWSIATATASVVCLVHQLTIAFGPHAIIPVPVLVDIALTASESAGESTNAELIQSAKAYSHLPFRRAGAAYAAWHMLEDKINNGWWLRYSSALFAFWFMASWALAVILIIALIWKLAQVVLSQNCRSQLTRMADIQQRVPEQRANFRSWWHSWRLRSSSRGWKYAAESLLGRTPWEARIPGEAGWIIYTRGSLTMIAIFILFIFGLYAVLWQPLAELALTPLNTMHTEGMDGLQTTKPFGWSLIAMWKTRWRADGDPAPSLFNSSSVTMLPLVDDPDKNACVPSAYHNDIDYTDFEIVIFKCNRSTSDFWQSHSGAILQTWLRNSISPDLQLTVNFTNLLSSGATLGNVTSVIEDAVLIFIGLTDNPPDVINIADATPLFPGMNLLSVATPHYRQRLQPAEAATLGIETYRTYLAAELSFTMTNPFISLNDINAGTATLHVAACADIGDWVVVQEFRAHSILDGLSRLGGLGSLISTLLVLLLGSSLMQSVIGTKPYSPFGVLHRKEKVLEACRRNYPALYRELEQLEADVHGRGILAFILDTLIDISPTGNMTPGRPHEESQETGREGVGIQGSMELGERTMPAKRPPEDNREEGRESRAITEVEPREG